MIDLQAIRERVEKATARPWIWKESEIYIDGGIHLQDGRVCGPDIYNNWPPNTVRGDQKKFDGEFVAHARQDIPDLLDLITELGNALKAARPFLPRPESLPRTETEIGKAVKLADDALARLEGDRHKT